MKNIKSFSKFNEELDSSTYISAGTSLYKKGHKARGEKLINYGKSKNIDIDSNIKDEFNFISSANKTPSLYKWDYKDRFFRSKDKNSGLRVIVPSNEGLIEYGSSSISPTGRIGKAYLSSRKESLEFIKFLKTLPKSELILNFLKKNTINDLYQSNDTIDLKD